MFEIDWYVKELQTKIIEVWTDTYVFSAEIWTEETSPKWNIFKIDTNGNKFYAISKIDWLPTNNKQFLPSEYLDLEYWYGRYTTKPTLTFTINNWDLTTSSQEVTLNLTIDSYLDVVKYFVSESDKLDLSNFKTTKPTSFTLSEWLWVKTLYVWVKDSAGNYSEVSSGSIELTEQLLTPENLEWEWFHEYEE